MPTQRRRTMATSRVGINLVRTIVERHNCIFQEIALDNDLGNDAYIEFIQEENATGCCAAVQIKSGSSFLSPDGSHFTFRADRAHFEYWRGHLLPVGVILVDPTTDQAAWLDITEHLALNPEVVNVGPYSISVPVSRGFSAERFPEFAGHFLRYRDQYRQDTNFGLALGQFANLTDPEGCHDGLMALFTFHRQRLASWYYVVSCFRNFQGHPILRRMVQALCHITGHMDIGWGPTNSIDEDTRKAANEFLNKRFGKEEVLILLESVDEHGFERGEIGQSAHAIIDAVRDRDRFLEELAFDPELDEEERYKALLLLIYYMQHRDKEARSQCLRYIEDYMDKYPSSHHSLLVEILWTVRRFGGLSFY